VSDISTTPVQPQNPGEHPIVQMSDADLELLLKRAIRITLGLGAFLALILLFSSGWRNAAEMAVGAAISAASLYEWQRLIRLFNARLDQNKIPRGAALVVTLFLVRLILFGAAIYGSLRCFQGSPIVLVVGLSLAVAGLVWEALRILRG
jgi:hypothetical protein